MKDDFVHVSAPARLHLGFLDPGGHSGRRFGGIGLALDAPATRLTIARRTLRPDVPDAGPGDQVEGPEAKRAAAYLGKLRKALELRGPYVLNLHETIPSHAGLGSGTQLALAVASGLRALEGLPADISADAALLGRGQRSGLGAAFLAGGGLAVDGGKGESDLPPPIVAHHAFPTEWRVILVLDPRTEGFHGTAELAAFATLPAFPDIATAEICRLVLMQALPGLIERDIAGFGAAIGTIQTMVGEHFAPAQGGVFTSKAVARACRALEAAGAHGIGQSSWGPTGFAFAGSQEEAERLVATLRWDGTSDGLDIRIARGRKHGATIEMVASHKRTGTG